MSGPLTAAIANQVARVVDLRAQLDGDGVELDLNEWLDAIEGETDFQEAIAEVAALIFEIDGQVAGVKAMEDRLAKRRGRLERSAESLRGVILAAMDKAGVPAIKRDFVTINAKPKPRELGEVEESQIPSDYFTPQPPKLDRLALRKDLRDGKSVPGARLDNGGLTLSLRFL